MASNANDSQSEPPTEPMSHAKGTPKTEPDAEAINLRVVSQDGSEVFFKIRRTVRLEKLMAAYCDRQSISPNSVRFMFDGERVVPESTAESLDMEEGDIIDAMLQQVGGGGHRA